MAGFVGDDSDSTALHLTHGSNARLRVALNAVCGAKPHTNNSEAKECICVYFNRDSACGPSVRCRIYLQLPGAVGWLAVEKGRMVELVD